jgi:hypothetical protein
MLYGAVVSSPFFSFSYPVINERGTVAFQAGVHGTPDYVAIVTGDGESTTLIADTKSTFSRLGFPTLNNAGTVVFQAVLTTGVEGIFIGNGRPIAEIADTIGGPFATFDIAFCDTPSQRLPTTNPTSQGRPMNQFMKASHDRLNELGASSQVRPLKYAITDVGCGLNGTAVASAAPPSLSARRTTYCSVRWRSRRTAQCKKPWADERALSQNTAPYSHGSADVFRPKLTVHV